MRITCLHFAARAGCLSWALASSVAQATISPAQYDALIAAARAGDTAPAIGKLRDWHRAEPDNSRVLYDLAAVLGMAGQHEAALGYYGRIVHADAPSYAIKAIAGSARATGRAKDAEAAYRLLIDKTPNDAEAHAGLAYAWLAQGRLQSAFDYIKGRLPATPAGYVQRDMPLLVALAELHEQRGDWLLAAATYQDVLRIEPDFRYAFRGRTFALNRAGAFHLASRLAESRPEAFDADELRRLAQDAAARTVVFGQAWAETDDTPTRHAKTDLALDQNAELARQYGDHARTKFDRLVAMRDRARVREAVDLYESLVADQTDVPAYARIAAADAYLHLGQPDAARDLYRAVLGDPENSRAAEAAEWRIALMYAYSEAEQHDEAQALADSVLRDMPALMHKGTAAVEAPNEEYARAALMAALTRLYADRFDEAQQRLAEMRALAPFNSGIRAAWASLQSARERPRAALEEFTLLQIDDPESVDAAIGHADSLLVLNRLDEARAMLGPLLTNYPDNKAVRELEREIDSQDGFHLKLDTTLGRGASVAGAESVLDATLYSPPLAASLGTPYRVFSRLSRMQGEAGEVSVSRNRFGAGLDYRRGDIRAEAELNHAGGGADRNGVAGAIEWTPSDMWRLHLALDTNINDLPAAAFRNDVTGRSLRAGVTWIEHESRKAGADLVRIRFSDDNTRDAVRAWWTERWISGPVFKFDITLALSASGNSLAGAAYFNPERDREASVTFAGEWLSWRRYERAFRQRLALTGGHYAQKGFAGGAVADLRYEHEWRNDPGLSLRYGLGHAFHPYDGEREHRNYAFLHLYWRIK